MESITSCVDKGHYVWQVSHVELCFLTLRVQGSSLDSRADTSVLRADPLIFGDYWAAIIEHRSCRHARAVSMIVIRYKTGWQPRLWHYRALAVMLVATLSVQQQLGSKRPLNMRILQAIFSRIPPVLGLEPEGRILICLGGLFGP